MKKRKPIELMHLYFGEKGGMDCCGTCCNLKVYQYGSKKVRKCVAYGGLHSNKADWAKHWEACGLYEKPVAGQMVSDTEKQRFSRFGICHDNGFIDGQIEMEAMKDVKDD